jgi:hypothetical protein
MLAAHIEIVAGQAAAEASLDTADAEEMFHRHLGTTVRMAVRT